MPVTDSWIAFPVNPVKVTNSKYIIKTHNVSHFLPFGTWMVISMKKARQFRYRALLDVLQLFFCQSLKS